LFLGGFGGGRGRGGPRGGGGGRGGRGGGKYKPLSLNSNLCTLFVCCKSVIIEY